jgi:hypothetical protein
MAKSIYAVLTDNFEEEIASSATFLENGGCKSYDEYREVVGRIRGLRLAIQHVKDLMRAQIEED